MCIHFQHMFDDKKRVRLKQQRQKLRNTTAPHLVRRCFEDLYEQRTIALLPRITGPSPHVSKTCWHLRRVWILVIRDCNKIVSAHVLSPLFLRNKHRSAPLNSAERNLHLDPAKEAVVATIASMHLEYSAFPVHCCAMVLLQLQHAEAPGSS
jgi:hypothetical protein